MFEESGMLGYFVHIIVMNLIWSVYVGNERLRSLIIICKLVRSPEVTTCEDATEQTLRGQFTPIRLIGLISALISKTGQF